MSGEAARCFELSDALIVIVDGAGSIVDVNPAAARALGRAAAELRGTPFVELVVPDEREAVRSRLASADREVSELLTRCEGAGEPPALTVAWTLHHEPDGGGIYAFGRVWSQREQRLREFERLFMLTDDLMIVYNATGRFTRVNPAVTRTLGYSEQELVATPFIELVHPDDVEDTLKAYAGALVGQNVVLFENRYRTASGEYRRLQWTATAIEESGKGYAVARDITAIERLQQNLTTAEGKARDASARLEETEHTYRQILDSLEDMVLVKREHSRLVWANKAFLRYYGMTLAQLEGIIDAPFNQPDYTLQYVVDDQKVWESRKPLHIPEEPVTHHDGTVTYFETVKSPIFDSQGEVKLTVGVSRDLTRRREAEQLRRSKEKAEEARRLAELANRTKSMFLANMSHELRTPLNAILGYAQMLEQTSGLDERQRRGVDVIMRSGEHLLALIDDILDLSRVEAGKLTLNEREFYVEGFLASIADICEVRARDKGLSFSFRVQTPLPTALCADETRLRQVLLNLLVNAIKFTEAGSVVFEVGYEGGKLRCAVEDTGIGIDQQQLVTIFEPFEQIQRGTRPLDGTGLGLAISNELLRMMGGSLHVTSERDRGSRFWFEIPAEATPGSSLERAKEPRIVGYEGERRRLLIVDDKSFNREALVGFLSNLGFEVLEATDGAEALKVAAREHPDLVFMDLVMPRVDGFEAARRLRADPATAAIRIVAISASVLDDSDERGRAAGCDDFITKPFVAERVFAVLGEQLGLIWISEGSEARSPGALATAADVREPPSEAGPASLPPARLAALHEAAGIGDVQGVLALLSEYVTGDGDAGGGSEARRFAARLRALARRFDLSTIAALTRPPPSEP